ncbi:hypothetical protein HII17_01570 [Thalassotalea sp. M1531]|uniref:Penicillin-binding protein activator n=1 Tax=Thalassotalea algicola TaxID=2716224 RepID=A0A7Y0L9C3_9GAMM|nr:penicillin-binding protein activator [Thalassotalea algicola]NMP30236.1 hypothetical protein [Thalassotalea algicola]
MASENFKKLVRTSLFAVLSASLLYGCSSPTPKVSKQIEAPKPVAQQQLLTAQDYTELSKTLEPKEAKAALLKACELYIAEDDALKALWLANHLQPLLVNPTDIYNARLLKAEALNKLNHPKLAIEQLALVNELNIKHSKHYYQLLSNAHKNNGFPVLSLQAKLNAFAINLDAAEEDIDDIWQSFVQLSPQQLSAFGQLDAPFIQGWLRLIQFANQFGANNEQLSRYLKQWQHQFPTHPANTIAMQLQSSLELSQEETVSTLSRASNIAVILPLTGKQQAAGNAAQQGILAAYANNATGNLHFIDSEKLDWATLTEQLNSNNIDFVIGPLLRERVKQYKALPELSVPTLFLNIPADQLLAQHQYAISMRPEDEATQAAATLSNKQYKMPIVLAYQDAVSQRIADAFIEEWQRVTGYLPNKMAFTKGKKMQVMLKSALGVEQSQERINDINRRIKQTIKADTRNRRDIDMIYIVGSPTQTRLLKPYIDVSISPFADAIPMYASSRSHSARIDEGDTRDLAGLSFSEMPWLLNSKQQNKQLVNASKHLFPNRSDSLQRIFAMGYDALALVDKVQVMAKRPYARHFGQIGTLTLNEQQILTRSLIWGRYFTERVTEIAMD